MGLHRGWGCELRAQAEQSGLGQHTFELHGVELPGIERYVLELREFDWAWPIPH